MGVRRILMTADTVGGVWTYALELARGLAREGVAVGLATMGAPLHPGQRRDAATAGVTLFESSYRLEWMDDPWEDVARAGRWLLEIERDFAPDIVHLNQYCFGALPFAAPALVVGHSCVLSWWRAVHGGDAPAEWNRYRREVAQGLRGAALLIAPTRAMMAALEEHYGPLPLKTVIPNGSGAGRKARPTTAPFIFSSGRLWDEAKNIAALEKIAPQLSWPVYVAGDTRQPGKSGQAKPPAPTASGFHLLGKLDSAAMAAWMSRAAVYALPAFYEPFGLSILEAASAGCALVLGDIPSLRENWDGAAAFVPPGDSGALAKALRRLIDSAEERIDLAARARRRSLGFTAGMMTGAYLASYAQIRHAAACPAP